MSRPLMSAWKQLSWWSWQKWFSSVSVSLKWLVSGLHAHITMLCCDQNSSGRGTRTCIFCWPGGNSGTNSRKEMESRNTAYLSPTTIDPRCLGRSVITSEWGIQIDIDQSLYRYLYTFCFYQISQGWHGQVFRPCRRRCRLSRVLRFKFLGSGPVLVNRVFHSSGADELALDLSRKNKMLSCAPTGIIRSLLG